MTQQTADKPMTADDLKQHDFGLWSEVYEHGVLEGMERAEKEYESEAHLWIDADTARAEYEALEDRTIERDRVILEKYDTQAVEASVDAMRALNDGNVALAKSYLGDLLALIEDKCGIYA